ncbi:MAG: DUF4091 domain-containing protein [Deltaproteobacteria bacterium]|nr:DUF4091 domain-containing protein [Deltaproteobacteria bacterium]
MLSVILAALLGTAPEPWAFATHSLVKVRPGAHIDRQSTVSLELGRNECQAVQVVVPEGAPVFDLEVLAAPLAGPDQKTLAVELSREVNLQLQHTSNAEGKVGPWPDILIPAVDPIAHEKRRAFPYSAPGSAPVAVWAEVCAPPDATPGTYRGELRVRARGREDVTIPFQVELLRYTLPATSSLPNAFGFSGISAAHAHALSADDPNVVLALTQRYATLALMHRISLFGMTMEPPPLKHASGSVSVDFRDYDRELAPFLDGTALPNGARFTTLELRGPAGQVADDERVAYYAATVKHLESRGWLQRLFLYAPDEPKLEQFPKVQRVAALAHRGDPRIRVLLTASRQPGLEGVADLWTPNMVCLFPRPEAKLCSAMVPQVAYDVERLRGAKLWWYQSCMSHGCGPTTGAESVATTGWPAYMIDLPATLNRAMGAAAYRFGIDGELYYSTTEAYEGGDPWRDVWRFDGNGDGTLFYPGTPARIGGKTDVPLASLRLKQLRDGLQDYELLKLADRVGLHALAQATAITLVPKAWEIQRDPSVWIAARRKLALAIDARMGQASKLPSR